MHSEPIQSSRLAFPLLSTAVVLLGMLFLLGGEVISWFSVPRQFYPVMTLHADITVTPSEVIVRDEPKGLSGTDDTAGLFSKTDTFKVSAFVRLYRPVPLRSSGRSGYRSYSPNYNQPRWEELQQAGPEYGVELYMHSARFNSGQITRSTFPHDPTHPSTFGEVQPMDDELVHRILPAFADWVYEMSGDQGFADGVRAGGTPIPPLPGYTFHFLLKWSSTIGGLLILLGMIPLAITKLRAARRDKS